MTGTGPSRPSNGRRCPCPSPDPGLGRTRSGLPSDVGSQEETGPTATAVHGRKHVVKISVIGCGYLGAVHAASMAELGHEVVGVDVDVDKIGALSQSKAPFYEPGFEELLTRTLETGRLRFTTSFEDARGSQVHFVCVGT